MSKPGYKTTEFWQTTATKLVAIGVSLKFLPQATADSIISLIPVVAPLLVMLANDLFYTGRRTKDKETAAWREVMAAKHEGGCKCGQHAMPSPISRGKRKAKPEPVPDGLDRDTEARR